MKPNKKLVIRVVYSGDAYHARRSVPQHGFVGVPEWPPSPYRFFCSLVNSYGSMRGDRTPAESALKKIESLGPPSIHAAPLLDGFTDFTRYVPNNHGDIQLKSGMPLGGDKVGKRELLAPFGASKVVVYEYDAGDGIPEAELEAITKLAYGVSRIGTSEDMCYVSNVELVDAVKVERGLTRHIPVDQFSIVSGLRTPRPGTFDDLQRCHRSSMEINSGGERVFIPPLKPSCFHRKLYCPEDAVERRPFVAFRLIAETGEYGKPGKPMSNLGVDNVTKVAAWVRHATIDIGSKNPPQVVDWKAALGADQNGKTARGTTPHRLSYIPLPNILGPHPNGNISRIILAEPYGGDGSLVSWAKDKLDGAKLFEKNVGLVGKLELIDGDDSTVQRFTKPSASWKIVTPAVVDGEFNRGKPTGTQIETLVVETIRHALASLKDSVTFWVGDLSKVERKKSMSVPKHLAGRSQVTMKLNLDRQIAGPVCIGGGRHSGTGLMAPISENG